MAAEQFKDAIVAVNTLYATLGGEIDRLKSEVEEKERVITSQKTQIQEQTQIIDTLKLKLTNRDDELAGLRQIRKKAQPTAKGKSCTKHS